MNRLTLTLAASALSICSAAPLLPAQTAPATPIAPPMLPFVVTYRYWPVQFVQWVGNELPYSMIELDVDPTNSKHPLLYVTLTDRATGKRIHYTDNDGLIASATAMGEEAHKTAIAYDPADNDSNGSISSVRFTMADGKPLQWRFVQGTDMSEQGRGLTPFPGTKVPIFACRELGAVAGEGTALQIGDVTSAAAVWTEISQPPYFIGYRGAETEGAHLLVFSPGKQNWKVASSPSQLTPGASWELDEEHGNHRSIRIDKIDGPHLVLTCTERYAPGVVTSLDVTRSGDLWSLDRVRFAPLRDGEKHFLTLELSAPLTPATDNTNFSLVAGKKNVIGTGSLAASSQAGDRDLDLSFTDPKWLNGVVMHEQTADSPAGITISAHP